jgi:hypothetical protein
MTTFLDRSVIPKDPYEGLVFRFGYLWHDEYQRNVLHEGAKHRPTVVVMKYEAMTGLPGRVAVSVCPITHRETEGATRIPDAIKRRMGLDDEQSWVVTSEVNRFFWPTPHMAPALVRDGKVIAWHWGLLPDGFFRSLKDDVASRIEEKRLLIVPRPNT